MGRNGQDFLLPISVYLIIFGTPLFPKSLSTNGCLASSRNQLLSSQLIQEQRYPVKGNRMPGPLKMWAVSDLKVAVTAQEAYCIDNQRYCDIIDELIGNPYGLYPQEGVVIYVISADEEHYEMVAFHEKGTKAYRIKGPGGIVQDVSKAKVETLVKPLTQIVQ